VKTSRLILAALITATFAISACKKNGDAATQPPEASPPAEAPAVTAETDAPPAEEPVAAAPKQSLATCGEPIGGITEIKTYDKLKLPARYWIMMKMAPESGLWIPAEPIGEKRRHTTFLELLNVDQFPALEDYPDQKIRFTIEATDLESNMDQEGNKKAWYDRLTATVVRVCVPAAAEPEG
jgi:hypothetical protein